MYMYTKFNQSSIKEMGDIYMRIYVQFFIFSNNFLAFSFSKCFSFVLFFLSIKPIQCDEGERAHRDRKRVVALIEFAVCCV